MSFRVERRFNLLLLEEGESYVADVSATMMSQKNGQPVAIKGRLRLCSKSLVFQPDEVTVPIFKHPYRYVRRIGDVDQDQAKFEIDCDQIVQISTTVGSEMRVVTPSSIAKASGPIGFQVHYANCSSYHDLICRLKTAADSKGEAAEAMVRDVLAEVTANVQFDMTRLSHRESALLQTHLWVRRIKPLLEVRGMLQISDEAIYFQAHPNFSSDHVKRAGHSDIVHVFPRIYGLQANALEIITRSGSCWYLCFQDRGQCDLVYSVIQNQRQKSTSSILHNSLGIGMPERLFRDVRRITALWQSGSLSNFHYLDFLNTAAGRSRNDFSQYPVFPWVLRDYKSMELNLDDPAVYRDLSKPIGALSEKRLASFKERMRGMTTDECFLYGTHYSTPAYVIYWLLRVMPERMLRMHSGHFDALARLFKSVSDSWETVNESSTSLMELVPEFFVLPSNWLENKLGITMDEGLLGDVTLPPWAKSPEDFICKMRAALESDYVSTHLPSWIDLIFGCKQRGEEALKADNLFHPICYISEASAIPKSSGMSLAAVEVQLQEFGRVPRQLFQEAHPPRLKRPAWTSPNKLKEDPMHSQPWYVVISRLAASSPEDEPDEAHATTSSTSQVAAAADAPTGGYPTSTGSSSIPNLAGTTTTAMAVAVGAGGGGTVSPDAAADTAAAAAGTPDNAATAAPTAAAGASSVEASGSATAAANAASAGLAVASSASAASPIDAAVPANAANVHTYHLPSTSPATAAAAVSSGAPTGPTSAVRKAAAQDPWKALRALRPRPLAKIVATGEVTGVICCASNLYSVASDGCLRIFPIFPDAEEEEGLGRQRRNFRVSPMPLSCVELLQPELLAIGGLDNRVTLYSSSRGSALAQSQVHADTVTCLKVSSCRQLLVSGSRDQSVRVWRWTSASLRNEETFDDLQQPVTCASADENLVLAGASDGQMVLWDIRSGEPVLERELGCEVLACDLNLGKTSAVALDATGVVRFWDLRRNCESVRLPVIPSTATSERGTSMSSLLTDFGQNLIVGGQTPHGAAVSLWDVPDHREVRCWNLGAETASADLLARLPRDDFGPVAFVSVSRSGIAHAFGLS